MGDDPFMFWGVAVGSRCGKVSDLRHGLLDEDHYSGQTEFRGLGMLLLGELCIKFTKALQ